MINLSKNAVHGQDAHSALIADLKQVLAKHELCESYADNIAGILPHRVDVGDVGVDTIEAELLREIQATTQSVYYRKKANAMAREAFDKYTEEFMQCVNIYMTEMELPQIMEDGCGDSKTHVYRFGRNNSIHRSSLNIWFTNKGYTGEENPVFNQVKVSLSIFMEVNHRSLTGETFECHSVADIFSFGKPFFKMMCAKRDVADSSVRWDLFDKFYNEFREIAKNYKAANSTK